MINLAGCSRAVANETVEAELHRCKIKSIEIEDNHPEVHTTIGGQLGVYTFRRQWYYWSVSGLVPLDIAEMLYADPCGRKDIRVGGHCGCPSPTSYGTVWIAPCGKKVLTTAEKTDCESYIGKETSLNRICQNILDNNLFADDPSQYPGVKGFVDGYHIDSELGLRLFADAVRGL